MVTAHSALLCLFVLCNSSPCSPPLTTTSTKIPLKLCFLLLMRRGRGTVHKDDLRSELAVSVAQQGLWRTAVSINSPSSGMLTAAACMFRPVHGEASSYISDTGTL
ncbi:hypothetical protein GOODEAATRI_003873 [Goodea atripinnis]|uniref:Secreted protein n=1 Tax=Goodea atripinnis TaxID=208336 RepID=A0ABV0PKN5_9TELE